MNKPFSKPLVFVGTPTNGEHSFLFSQSVSGLIFPTNHSMQMSYVPYMEVGRARNILVQAAREAGAKFLLFWDEDVIVEANGLRRLVNHMLQHEDWDVVGGVYATKTYPPEPLLYTDWGQGPCYGWKKGDMVHCKAIGNGFTLFRMSVFDRIGEERAPWYEDRNPWNGKPIIVQSFFNTGTSGTTSPGQVDKAMWTEDMYFFHMAEEVGIQVWADTSIKCNHYDKKTTTFFMLPVRDDIAVKAEPWNLSPLVCNLGAGMAIDPTEVSVDLRDDPRLTYRCDVRSLPEDWGGRFDLVKSSHVLEHFGFGETDAILQEWIRLVKPGGKLRLILPDLQYAAQLIAGDGALDTYLLGLIYGDQGHEFWQQDPYGGIVNGEFASWSFANNHHKSGFTPRFMQARLEYYGLTDITIRRDGIQFMIEGTK